MKLSYLGSLRWFSLAEPGNRVKMKYQCIAALLISVACGAIDNPYQFEFIADTYPLKACG